MNRSRFTYAAVLIVFLVTNMVSPLQAEEEDSVLPQKPPAEPILLIGEDTVMQEVTPGEPFDLVIPVHNVGGGRASNVVASLVVADMKELPFELQQMSTTVTVPKIEGFSWVNIRFDDLRVAPQAQAKVYPLQVQMSYKTETGGGGSASGTVYLKVGGGGEAPRLKYTGLQLENDKPAIEAGEEETLTLKIQNPSDYEIRDLKLQLTGFNNAALMLRQPLDTWEEKLIPGQEFRFIPFKIMSNDELETGTYPLSLQLSYKDAGGHVYEDKDIQVFVPVEGRVGGTDKKNTPRLIIENFNYGSRYVAAGNTFGLGLLLCNTSQSRDLVNIKLSFTSDDNIFSPVGSSNTVFIDKIGAGQRLQKNLQLRSKVDAESKTYNLNIEMEYEDIKGNKFTEKGLIGIDVAQKTAVQLSEVQLPVDAHVGEEFPLTMDFYNTGRSVLRNVLVTLEGDNFRADKRSSYVGNMEKGKSDYFDARVTPEQAGTLKGNIKLTYEDELGNTYQANQPFSIEVQEIEQTPENMGPEMPEEQEEESVGWGKPVAIGAGVLVLVSIYKIYRHRKKKREDAELDE